MSGQRALEQMSIAVFAGLVALESWQLAAAAGAWLLPLALVAAPIGWLAMDVLSGLVHFACDSFGSPSTPFIGPGIIRPFREHHAEPEAMTRHGFVETHGNSCLAALPLLAVARATSPDGALVVLDAVLLFTALGALASNQCHKWAHMDERAVPRLVRRLQRRGLLLSRDEHRLHHTAPFDSHFCMAAGWMNRPMNALLRALR